MYSYPILNTEHDPQNILQDPGPLALPEGEPGGGGGNAGGQQEELSELQLEDAEVEIAPGQSQHWQPGHTVARHHQGLQAAVHGQAGGDAEHTEDDPDCNNGKSEFWKIHCNQPSYRAD